MTADQHVMPHFKDRYQDLRRLVKGITIGSIAEFDLETCKEDEAVEHVLERMSKMDIDQMPVDPERTHYIVKADLGSWDPGTLVREVEQKPIAPPMLIAEGTPLSQSYALFRDTTFLFVLRGNRVEGIVTRGDFQRLPFRMYLFGLFSLLEMGITRLVLCTYGDEGWRSLPCGTAAVKEAEHWYKKAKERGEEPRYKFEVVSLARKLGVLIKAEEALKQFTEEERQLIVGLNQEGLKKLRDNLAHVKDLTQGFNQRWDAVFEITDQLHRVIEAMANAW